MGLCILHSRFSTLFFSEDLQKTVLTDTPRLDSLLIVVDPVMYFIYVSCVEYGVLNLKCVAESVVNYLI